MTIRNESLHLVNKRDKDDRIVKSWVCVDKEEAKKFKAALEGRRKSTSQYSYTVNKAIWANTGEY